MAAWIAWHAGAIAQAAKIPKLADLMPEADKPKRKASPDELLSLAARWNAHLGGRLIALPREAPAQRRV